MPGSPSAICVLKNLKQIWIDGRIHWRRLLHTRFVQAAKQPWMAMKRTKTVFIWICSLMNLARRSSVQWASLLKRPFIEKISVRQASSVRYLSIMFRHNYPQHNRPRTDDLLQLPLRLFWIFGLWSGLGRDSIKRRSSWYPLFLETPIQHFQTC